MKRCGVCGSTKLSVQNIKGTLHPWKDYTQVELLFDQDALVCENCGNQILNSQDILKLDENIRESIKLKVNESIKFMTEELGLSQESLAPALGITPVYLSMVKNGKKRLSFTAFNLLQCYRNDPQQLTMLTGVKIKQIKAPSQPALQAYRLVWAPSSRTQTTRVVSEILECRTPQHIDVSDAWVGYELYNSVINAYKNDSDYRFGVVEEGKLFGFGELCEKRKY